MVTCKNKCECIVRYNIVKNNGDFEVINTSIADEFLTDEIVAKAIYQDVIDFYNHLKLSSKNDFNLEHLDDIKTRLIYFINIRDEKLISAGRDPLCFLPQSYEFYVKLCENICWLRYGIK